MIQIAAPRRGLITHRGISKPTKISQPQYFNLGIEPATLPIDNLAAAENSPVLQLGETRCWSLEVDLNA